MTKIKKPLFSLGAQGKLGPLVISRLQRGSHKVAVKRPPANPRSPAQLLIRDYYGSGVETYRTLDEIERLYYHNLYKRQRGHRAYLNFIKEWMMAKLPLHAPDHAEAGRDPIKDPLHLDAIPPILTNKDADTLDSQHGIYYAQAIAEGRAKSPADTHYSLPGVSGVSVTTLPYSGHYLFYQPILIPTPITIDRLAIMITTPATADKVARLGIYNADVNWQPTTLVLDATTVPLDSTGKKEITVNQPLTPGRYLLTYHSNDPATLRVMRGTLPGAFIEALLSATFFLNSLAVSQIYGPLLNPGKPWTLFTQTSTPFHYPIFLRLSEP